MAQRKSCFCCQLRIANHDSVSRLGLTFYSVPATMMILNLRGHVENRDHGRGVVAADIVLGEVSDFRFAHRSGFDAEVSYIQSYNRA
jgi:hypothetical protein